MVKKLNKGSVKKKPPGLDSAYEDIVHQSKTSNQSSSEREKEVAKSTKSNTTDFQATLAKTKCSILAASSDTENEFNPNGNASSEMFFELANAKTIQDGDIVISQDIKEDLDHSGGIIWETSYLLYQYLVHNIQHWEKLVGDKTQLLEIGAGCGYLGCSLGKKFKDLEVCSSFKNRGVIKD